MPQKILIIDDEETVTDIITRYLAMDGYEVRSAADGAEGLQLARAWLPDLVVLDLMLPGMDGLTFCRRLRLESTVPVIILSARGEEVDKVVGLEIGADDYMSKPFSPRELVARIKAIFRRVSEIDKKAVPGALLQFSGLSLDASTRSVRRDGQPVELTAKEFDLLYYLASHAAQVFTRAQLMDSVWDYSYAGDSSTVTVHIRRLREKVEAEPARPRFIKTVWGVGYKFEADSP